MGIDIDANLAIGAIVIEDKQTISQEILDDKYEGYLSEYLYTILEDDGLELRKTNEYSEEIVVYLGDTLYSTEWDAVVINLEKLKISKIDKLKSILDKHNIIYEDIGVVLFPYYSH